MQLKEVVALLMTLIITTGKLVHVMCFHCTRLALLPFVLTKAEKIFCTSLTHISTVSALLCNTLIAHLTDVVHT
jgi:hypothetical protein